VYILWGNEEYPGDPVIKQAFENRAKFQLNDSAD
jgi:hypothetical protein